MYYHHGYATGKTETAFMKKTSSLSLLLIPICLFQNNSEKSFENFEDEDLWTGTVSFVERQTGKNIEISLWKMEATITNNKGMAMHSFQFTDVNGTTSACKNGNETELSVGIDFETKKYSIEVPMPGCYGKTISGGKSTDFAKTDETAISISHQPLKDPNLLEGTITENPGTDENGTGIITTYKWRLEKVNKKNKPVSQNPKPPSKPPVTQPFAKEKWTGTVNWTKTSQSKARVVEATVTSHWDDYFLFQNEVSFVNSKGTVYRVDKTTKWRLDSIDFVKKGGREMIEEKNTTIICNGKAEMELEILYSADRKYYWVSFFTPDCPEIITHTVKNNIHGNSNNTTTNNHQGGQVTLPATAIGEFVGRNPNVLTGTWEEIIPTPNDPGGGSIITRATWILKKVN